MCTRMHMYMRMHVYVRVCACLYTCIGYRRITNRQLRTNLPGIEAAKSEALPEMGGCPRRGKL